ncbi:2-dehydro-3-deoxygluconokinase [Paenibacillus albidus]|uniref:2-dehydro-3-deoxygluconokinase n=1 Tax=Paenibacillus albidus TaxID=2041023 RepID=A0A917FJ02_9BACL|nr:sugar kinase [Paenibacillus albidus]GGF88097.1 2-dehydro-3-deoxygluconokinase [Paenibacillus albidus]
MSKRIAAFGEVMMRLQVPGHELLSQGSLLKYSFSGSGVGVLSALARYGHRGSLVTRLPANPVGDAALAGLRRLGIDSEDIQRGGNSLGIYFLENGFGARPGRVTYSGRAGSSFNTAPPGAYPFAELADKADAVHFCGITLAMNEGVSRAMKTYAEAVKRRGGLVIFDCNYRPSLWGEGSYELARPHYEEMLQLADIVLMNEKDAIHILGMNTVKEQREEQLLELIPAVAARYSLCTVAGTHRVLHGDNRHSLRGYIYKADSFAFSDTLTFSVLDRVGAGDAYASGIIHGELEGFDPQHSVSFAAAAGMLAHTVEGDSPMASEQDVFAVLAGTVRDVQR